MKLIVKIKFGSEKEKIVRFGGDRYLIYLTLKKEEPGAMKYFIDLISKELGLPPNRIQYSKNQGENYIFDVE
jgi:hypothetical protein